MKQKFYVCHSWHDFPEGGTYATVVTAESHEEAEHLCKIEMAASIAFDYGIEDEPDQCANCGNTDQDGSDICIDCGSTHWNKGTSAEEQAYNDYAGRWYNIDCHRLVDSPMGQILIEILKAWDEPYYGDHEAQLDRVSYPIQKAKEYLYP